MESLVKAIFQKEGLTAQSIQPLSGGQVNQVFRVDGDYVLRIGAREDALQRLKQETERLQSLEGKVKVPKIVAFGQHEAVVYQIQRFIPGQKLYLIWKNLRPSVQEAIAAQLAAQLKTLHSAVFPNFGIPHQAGMQYAAWSDYLSAKFAGTLAELQALNIRMAPGFVEMAAEYFDQHRHVLQAGVPTLVHGDLTLVNILVDKGELAALLDLEYAMQAPADYELWTLEAFCLYPNDWAEEDQETCSSADFANLIPLLRKYDPALFEVPNLRERLNLYHLDAALGSYLAWRKDNLSTIPPERMAAKEFYMARITNFVFNHGARMFYA